jgi:hypothetical protein
VSGGAYGNPNFAAMKPVLHRNTKNTGTGESQAWAGVVTNGLEMLKRLQSSMPYRAT